MPELNIEHRLEICRKCPIYDNGRCSARLWINPDTDEVVTYPKFGFIRGCNCYIEIKASNPLNHCIAGKW